MISTSDGEVPKLKEQFKALDRDGSGMIKAKELQEICQKNDNIDLSTPEINKIIKEVDYFGNGMINYSEFLAATLDAKSFLLGEEGDAKLRSIFQQFDTDNTGQISAENIKIAMQKMGREISQDEIGEILEKHDKNKNGKLDFEEFKSIFNFDDMNEQKT